MQRWMRSAPVRSDALFASSKASTFYVADYSTFFIFFLSNQRHWKISATHTRGYLRSGDSLQRSGILNQLKKHQPNEKKHKVINQ